MTQDLLIGLSLGILLAALVIGLWPRLTGKTATSKPTQVGKLEIALECDAGPAQAALNGIKATLQQIADLQAKTGLDGRVDVREPGQYVEFQNIGDAKRTRIKVPSPTPAPKRRHR